MRRCGKPGCRCQRGEAHGPYYYRFWREDGRLRKQYVSRHDVQRIRDLCDQRRKDHKEIASTWEKWQKLTPGATRGGSPAEETTPDALIDDTAIGREMASAYDRMFKCFRDQCKLSPEEALQHTEVMSAHQQQRVLDGDPGQVSWFDFHQLHFHDPKLAKDRWEEMCHLADDELQHGHRAAKAMEASAFGPWERAQFLAIRNDLSEEWQPQNGMERTLIDTLAQAHTSYLFWMERLTLRSVLEVDSDNQSVRDTGRWKTPRTSEAEAIDQAAAMVDRFNKLFMRTLRALRDLRRYSPTIVVQNAGQVNVSEQQVNITATDLPDDSSM